MKFYKYNSNPLESVPLSELVHGEIYANDEGMAVKFDESVPGLEIIQSSELSLGEELENLSPKALGMYWKLMNYYKKNNHLEE